MVHSEDDLKNIESAFHESGKDTLPADINNYVLANFASVYCKVKVLYAPVLYTYVF